MGRKNIDIICVVVLSVWINFFPSNNLDNSNKNRLGKNRTSYDLTNINSPYYPYLRYIVPIGGAIGCIILRIRRKKDDE